MPDSTDDATRVALAEKTWVPDGRYEDPMFEATGPSAVAAMVAGAQAQFPGQKLRGTSALDAHHATARFTWELFAADGSITVAGLDIVEVAPDGRLARVTGFFGEPAPL